MTNIALFDEYVARILGALYESFPILVGLDALKLSGSSTVNEDGLPVDEKGNPHKPFDVCMGTIDWLIDTGYIDAKHRDQYGFIQCVLTARGLEILKAVPKSVQVHETIGEKLVCLVRAGAIDLAREAASVALSSGLGRLG